MNVRPVLYVAVLVTAGLWAGTVWSAPAKAAPTHPYVVHAGDGGWWAIAHAHGVPMDRLLAANHATLASPVKVGQTLQMPGAARPAKAAAAPAPAIAKPTAKPATKKPVHAPPKATK